MWCMAHRLELAMRDALKSTTFDMIDDLQTSVHAGHIWGEPDLHVCLAWFALHVADIELHLTVLVTQRCV